MPLGKGQRRVLRTAGFIGVALVTIWILLPVWFPWVLRPLTSGQSIYYGSYKRIGYSRFILGNVGFTNQNVHLHARGIELATPGAWLWQRVVSGSDFTKRTVQISDWIVVVVTHDQHGRTEGTTGSTYTNVTKLFPVLEQVNRWVPAASLTNGSLQAPGLVLKLPFATLINGTIHAKLHWPEKAAEADLTACLDHSEKMKLGVRSDALNDYLTLIAERDESGLRLEATNYWGTNIVRLVAQFARSGKPPEIASLDSDELNFPAGMLGLPGYETVTGSLHGTWRDNQFALDIAGGVKPSPSGTNFPPASLRLHAVGNAQEATIETAKISSSWLTADLSKQLRVYFSGPVLKEPAHLNLTAELDKQTLIPATGTLRGHIDFAPETTRFPRGEFELEGTGLVSHSWIAQTASIKGNVVWPWLQVDESRLTLRDGSAAVLTGKINLQGQLCEGIHAKITGPFARRFLPSGMDYEKLSADVRLSGPIKAIQHNGTLQVSGFSQSEIKPLDARLRWKGIAGDFQDFDLTVNANSTVLKLAGSLELHPAGVKGSLREVLLSTNAVPTMELKAPAHFEFDRLSGKRWRAAIDSFQVGGSGEANLSANIDWPRQGKIRLSARDIGIGFLEELLKNPPEEIHLDTLAATAAWTNGPVSFEVEGYLRQNASFKPAAASGLSKLNEFGLLSLRVELKGDASGISISNLFLTSQTSQIMKARGILPMTFEPGANLLHFMREKPLGFSAQTDPESPFWTTLSEQTGIILRKPNLLIDISGTWAAPLGTMSLQANGIDIPRWHGKIPALSKLNLEMALNRSSAWLTNCQILVQGQPVRFSGGMPLSETFWRDAEQLKLPAFDKASGNLLIDKANLGAFAYLFPTVLSPQGALSANITLLPGGNLEGKMIVQNGRSRPLPNIGPLRDVDLELHFQNRTVQLASASMRIGSATVFAEGQGDLRGAEWMRGIPPPFEFSLRGTNVPLSRQPSSIIRANLDLSVRKTNREPPLISGQVRLLNSYFLSDLRDLVPGRTASVARRPPYFSIEDPELARWRLSLRVIGPRAVKVRTTLFIGEAGPTLRVQGTLHDPIATGDIKIDTGQIRLPFATLDVQQGFVTLTSEDPYRPRLQVTAASKRFGYDVRMEITGPVDQPVIQFTSTPPLSSEQLFLMVTAGELPRGAYNLSAQQRAQTVALFLGKDLLAKLGFGDQNSQRLTFNSGENISQAGRPTYAVDYKLTDKWSLEGEYDRFNAYNAGLKWKVYSK